MSNRPQHTAQLLQLLKNSFLDLYSSTWPPEGYDPISKTFIDESISNNLLEDKITQVTSFFGLPNRCTSPAQSMKNIGRNFLGWEENKSEKRNIINYIKTIYALPKNFIFIFLRTLHSLVAFFTEFFPAALVIFCKMAAIIFSDKSSCEQHTLLKFFYNVMTTAFICFGYLFDAIHLIGKAVTSPIDAVRNAWDMAHQYHGDNNTGHIFGVLCCLFSIGITVTVYAFIFFAIPACVDLTTLATALETILTALDISLTTAFAITGAITGLAFTTVGTLIHEYIVKPLNDLWNQTGYNPKEIKSDYVSLLIRDDISAWSRCSQFFRARLASNKPVLERKPINLSAEEQKVEIILSEESEGEFSRSEDYSNSYFDTFAEESDINNDINEQYQSLQFK
jgi:hypothetical protein